MKTLTKVSIKEQGIAGTLSRMLILNDPVLKKDIPLKVLIFYGNLVIFYTEI